MGNIILIGFMGCGKSSIGKYMSKRRRYKLIDTDSYIEEKEGRSINEIFASDGEAYFRQLETDCIRELIEMSGKKLVVAVGGGLPMRGLNRELLHELGTIVYLRTSIDTLEKRLQGDDKRPLLQGGELRTKIENLFAQRESTYEELADIIVDTDNRTYAEVFMKIKENLK